MIILLLLIPMQQLSTIIPKIQKSEIKIYHNLKDLKYPHTTPLLSTFPVS